MQLADNLIHTGSYEFNQRPHTVYPPGFSATLAAAAYLAGSTDYSFLIRLMPVFWALGLVAWYFLLAKEYDPRWAATGCLLVATSPAVYQMTTRSVMSDPLYFAVSGWAFLAAVRLDRSSAAWTRWLLATVAATMVVGAVMVRSVGLSVCAAMIAWIFSEAIRSRNLKLSYSRGAALTAALAGLAAFLVWAAWSRVNTVPDYPGQHMSSYLSQMMTKDPHKPELGTATVLDVAQRVPENAVIHAAHLASTYFHGVWVVPVWRSVLGVIVLLLVATGIAASIWSGDGALAAWYMLGYASLYLTWPFDEGQRFMLPAAPLGFALLCRGAKIAAQFAMRQRVPAIKAVWVLPVCVVAAVALIGRLPGAQANPSLAFWLSVTIAGTLGLVASGRVPVVEGDIHRLRALSGIPSKMAVVVVALLMSTGVYQQAVAARENLHPDPSGFRHAASVDAARWLRQAPPGNVMAGQLAVVHRLTMRPCIPFPISSDSELIASLIHNRDVRYLVVCDRLPFEYFEPDEETRLSSLQRAHPRLLRDIHRGPGYRIFQVTSTRDAAPDVYKRSRTAADD
ncbi:MAG: hypothetical protein KIT83_03600 [Bryobacterales bacterium]|nr:hypothetical protein [Bryobacterales bacterium]